MRPIRASEIATYVFCQRAWWYRLQGLETDNREALTSGQEIHARHGRNVLLSGCLQTVAFMLAVLAVVMAAVYLTLLWIG